MDIIGPEVGTVGQFLLQGRVVVILMDMDTKNMMILLGLLSLEYNPVEWVGRGILPVGWAPVQAVRYGMLKL